jgi:hypothetical protein
MAYRATHGFGATPLADGGGSFCSFGVNWPSAVLPFVLFVCASQPLFIQMSLYEPVVSLFVPHGVTLDQIVVAARVAAEIPQPI